MTDCVLKVASSNPGQPVTAKLSVNPIVKGTFFWNHDSFMQGRGSDGLRYSLALPFFSYICNKRFHPKTLTIQGENIYVAEKLTCIWTDRHTDRYNTIPASTYFVQRRNF